MKKILLFVVVLVAIGGATGYLMYNKPHKNMASAKAAFQMPANQLFEEFEADETAANTKYLDQVVEVRGKVLSVSRDDEGSVNITLDAGGMLGGVICQLDPLSEQEDGSLQEGDEILIKGICTGMLMDVVLVRCVIL